MIWRAFTGLVVGLIFIGIVAGILLAIGVPTGPLWLVIVVPFLAVMMYGAAIDKRNV